LKQKLRDAESKGTDISQLKIQSEDLAKQEADFLKKEEDLRKKERVSCYFNN
jgi:hypothetical protein